MKYSLRTRGRNKIRCGCSWVIMASPSQSLTDFIPGWPNHHPVQYQLHLSHPVLSVFFLFLNETHEVLLTKPFIQRQCFLLCMNSVLKSRLRHAVNTQWKVIKWDADLTPQSNLHHWKVIKWDAGLTPRSNLHHSLGLLKMLNKATVAPTFFPLTGEGWNQQKVFPGLSHLLNSVSCGIQEQDLS